MAATHIHKTQTQTTPAIAMNDDDDIVITMPSFVGCLCQLIFLGYRLILFTPCTFCSPRGCFFSYQVNNMICKFSFYFIFSAILPSCCQVGRLRTMHSEYKRQHFFPSLIYQNRLTFEALAFTVPIRDKSDMKETHSPEINHG